MLRHVPPDSERSSGTEGISEGSVEVTCDGRGRVVLYVCSVHNQCGKSDKCRKMFHVQICSDRVDRASSWFELGVNLLFGCTKREGGGVSLACGCLSLLQFKGIPQGYSRSSSKLLF